MSNKGIPLHFQPLDQEVARKLVENVPCIFDKEQEQAEALYRQHRRCPNGCGETMEKAYGGTEFAFASKNWNIPRCVMACYACGCSINPFDGMVISVGDKNKAVYGNVPIINPNGDSR